MKKKLALILILAMTFSIGIELANAESKPVITKGTTLYNVYPIAISKKNGLATMILKWNKVEGAEDYTVKVYNETSKKDKLEEDAQVFHTKNTKIKIAEGKSFEQLPKNFRMYANMQDGTVNEMWFKNGRNINGTREQFIKNMVKKAFYKKPRAKDAYKAKARQIWRLTNKKRVNNGLVPLAWSEKAYKAAKIRAKELPVKFSHERPDGTGYSSLLTQLGIRWIAVGENVAMGQKTAQEVVRDWMNSPGYRANILSGDFKYLAVGVHYYRGDWYYVQTFCSY